MPDERQNLRLRVAMQPKAMLILAVVALGAVGGGVWFYLPATRSLPERLLVVAEAITACAIPLGYLLVWRVFLQPLRHLAATAHRMAEGDFNSNFFNNNANARTGGGRNDEIGKLAAAFEALAERVRRAQRQLRKANERLEVKVARRTAKLAEANRRLTAEMAEKEEFLRAVSHDLGAPLRNIAGMATMLLLKFGPQVPQEVRHRLERIRANADAQAAMIADVLELSRIRLGSPRRQEVDLAEVLAEQARHFEFELQGRDIRLEVAGPMPHLYVEKARIAQLFQNLIDNAIKYMDKPAGGRILVSHRIDGPDHEFRITDNGPGVPADQQREIFCLFRRARTAQAAKVPGKGVGLAVVSAIASSYGGRAWVESQEGQGASFCFTLSIEQTVPPAAGDSPRERREAPPSGAFRTPEKDREGKIPCAEKAGQQDRTSD